MKIHGRSIFGTRAFVLTILSLTFLSPLVNLASSQQNSFTLTALPDAITVSQAGQATVALIVEPVGNFSQTVHFQPANVTGLPNGTTVSFQPEQVTPPANVTMIFTASLFTANGSYGVTVCAVSGSINQSVLIQLTIVEDHISPTTGLTVDGVTEPDGKYGSDVLVTLVAEDNANGSGVAETAYNINNSSWTDYSEPFLVNLDGNFTIQYNSTDYAGNVEQTKTANITIEKPIKINGDAFYTNSPTVNLTLSAELVMSSVINMSFSNNNITWTEWEAYVDTRAWYLSDGEGLKTVYVKFSNGTASPAYFDTITLATTPPTTTASLSGTVGDNGWYISNVQVEFQVDSTAPLNETRYRLDNGTWEKYDQPINITIDGQILVEFNSTDKAGNVEETKNITVKVDKTPPAITIVSPEPKSYAFKESITVSFQASDPTSGLVNVNATLDDVAAENGSVRSDLPLGEHTLSVTAVDLAGNNATKTVTFSVSKRNEGGGNGDGGKPTTSVISVTGLIDAIDEGVENGSIDNRGIARSLIAKLEACQKKIGTGQNETAVNILYAFINQVRAQRGKHIQANFADELIERANSFIKDLEPAS